MGRGDEEGEMEEKRLMCVLTVTCNCDVGITQNMPIYVNAHHISWTLKRVFSPQNLQKEHVFPCRNVLKTDI